MSSDRHFFPNVLALPNRVLMTADTVGGVWTYVLELARVLYKQDVEIALATMGARLTSAQRHEIECIPNLRVFESTYKLEWMHEPWQDVQAAGEWLLDLERRLRPDIVHLNNYAHGTLPFSAPKLVVAHSDVLSWWRAVKGEEAPVSWNQYRDVVRTGLRSADLIVAPSTCALADVIHHYGPLRKTAVVRNGREISFRRAAKEPFIFSSGRLWDEAKNISTLAGIASELSWPVHVAGDTTEPCGKSVSFRNVRLLGRLNASQMAEQFERAAIYCLPVRYEPFGLSALEAALAGCALVLGDIPSQREIWRDAVVFVEPNDARALHSALQRLIEDPTRRRELADRAQDRATQFTPLQMASSYLGLYSGLMEQPRYMENACAS
ncbi:MAG TPA: glycosyltransferase family 4 protein [Verrucomicrobiae bacterium]|jgi:glycosyltransferase involved in cell wall biosynthesis